MRIRVLTVLAAAAWLVTSAPTAAHHSFAAEFDINQPVTLTGILSRMEWINPHGWVYVDVKNNDGSVTTWAVETGAPNALQRRGARKTDFPVGVEVKVTGYRAKSGKAIANGRTITFPDGRDFFFGSSGTGEPADGAEKRSGNQRQ
jgi:DNA/RNA endonuclease YhcR with UshA esterase domain